MYLCFFFSFLLNGHTWVAAELILRQRFSYVCLDRSLLHLLVEFLPTGLTGLPLLRLINTIDRPRLF